VSADGITIIIAEKWSEKSVFSGIIHGVTRTAEITRSSFSPSIFRVIWNMSRGSVPDSVPGK
jgi:hypothetical protein